MQSCKEMAAWVNDRRINSRVQLFDIAIWCLHLQMSCSRMAHLRYRENAQQFHNALWKLTILYGAASLAVLEREGHRLQVGYPWKSIIWVHEWSVDLTVVQESLSPTSAQWGNAKIAQVKRKVLTDGFRKAQAELCKWKGVLVKGRHFCEHSHLFRLRLYEGMSTVTVNEPLQQTFQGLLSHLPPLSVISFKCVCLLWTAVADSHPVLLSLFHWLPLSRPTHLTVHADNKIPI